MAISAFWYTEKEFSVWLWLEELRLELGLKVEVGVGEGFPLPWVIIFFIIFSFFSTDTKAKNNLLCNGLRPRTCKKKCWQSTRTGIFMVKTPWDNKRNCSAADLSCDPRKKKKQCKLFVSLGTMRRSELIASVFNLHLPCDFHSGVSHWFWLAWLDSVPSYAAINQMSIFVRADEIIVVWAKRETQNHWAGGLKTQSNCPLSSCPSERGDGGMRGWELHRGAEDWWSHNLSFHSPQWAFG